MNVCLLHYLFMLCFLFCFFKRTGKPPNRVWLLGRLWLEVLLVVFFSNSALKLINFWSS